MCLLGQNVNSYRDLSENSFPMVHSAKTNLSRGFSTIYRSKEGGRRFADLLYYVSMVSYYPSKGFQVTGTGVHTESVQPLFIQNIHTTIMFQLSMAVSNNCFALVGYSRRVYQMSVQKSCT